MRRQRWLIALTLSLAAPGALALSPPTNPSLDPTSAAIPPKAQALFTAGNEHLAKKRWAKAEAALAEAVRLAPLHLAARVNLSIAIRRQGKAKLHEALVHAQAACEQDFNVAEARYQRGVLWALMGNAAKAKGEHRWLVSRALPLGPELAAVIEHGAEAADRPLLGAMHLPAEPAKAPPPKGPAK